MIVASIVAVDGGVDAGESAPDLGERGIHFVTSAQTCAQIDGGTCADVTTLGPGWWLSRERMTIVGRRIVALENDVKALRSERDQMRAELADIPWVRAAMIGLGVGVLVGAGGTLYLETRLK